MISGKFASMILRHHGPPMPSHRNDGTRKIHEWEMQASRPARRFFWQGHRIEIREIIDRWHAGGRDPEWPIADYFKIVAADDRHYLVKHDVESNEWHLVE
jgi:hypothetical protein